MQFRKGIEIVKNLNIMLFRDLSDKKVILERITILQWLTLSSDFKGDEGHDTTNFLTW